MSRKNLLLLLTFVVLWIAFAPWCLAPKSARSQELPTESAINELILRVARTAVNEGAFKHRNEAALVWQTVRSSTARVRSADPLKITKRRIEWLSQHSARVNGRRPCLGGNCMWTPNLERDGALPAGLVIDADYWRVRVAPLWLDTLRYVDWMVRGERESEDPCHVSPRTWGCEADRAGALARGLYPIGCRRPRGGDDGFAYAKDCWRGRWLCDPLYEPAVTSEPPSPLDMSIAFTRAVVLR
jgi:hypothetical protein